MPLVLMPSAPVRRAVLRLLAGLAALVAVPARGEDASPWSPALHGRARLVDGGRGPQGRLAGVEIALDPGFKTYWREPGESGLPPALDWSGSDNLAEARLLWPAPRREEDAGGVAYAYEGGTILPVVVVPADPQKPVALRLALEYGICKDICIPAKAELALDLPPQEREAIAPALQTALAQVPRAVPLGETSDGLAVTSVAVRPGTEGRPVIAVGVTAPEGSRPALFAEVPAGFFVLPPAVPTREGATDVFALPLLEAPPKRPAQFDLTLTLTASGQRPIEVHTRLDTAAWPR